MMHGRSSGSDWMLYEKKLFYEFFFLSSFEGCGVGGRGIPACQQSIDHMYRRAEQRKGDFSTFLVVLEGRLLGLGKKLDLLRARFDQCSVSGRRCVFRQINWRYTRLVF